MKKHLIGNEARTLSRKEELRLTRPPRLEGKAKNAKLNLVRKKKGAYQGKKLKKI